MSYLSENKTQKEKLHFLLDCKLVEHRNFFSEQYVLSRDERDIENDLYSFTFCETDYLINRETAKGFKLLFDFFVNWRVWCEHKKFVEELKEKFSLLPVSTEIQKEFYSNGIRKQLEKYSLLNQEVKKSKWLNYLMENAIELIYDFEEFLSVPGLNIFIHNFEKVKPSFDMTHTNHVTEKEIDLFYDTFETFYLIERYFKTDNLQLIYECEIISRNIEYLKERVQDIESPKPKENNKKKKQLNNKFSYKAIAIAFRLSGIDLNIENAERHLKKYSDQENPDVIQMIRVRDKHMDKEEMTNLTEDKSADTKHFKCLKEAERLISLLKSQKGKNEINRIITAFVSKIEVGKKK